jgi:phospholipid/cholesterol/gamma-HCH transport system substrate-binding protein
MNEPTSPSTTRRTNGPSDQEMARAVPPLAGAREVQIGVFVLLGIVAILTALFLLTDPGTFRGRYTVYAEFETAGGVRKGDPVQLRGVNVGRVRGFDLLGERVRMELEVNRQWRIPTDSRARLAGVGLLGGRTVEIVPGAAGTFADNGSVLVGDAGDDIFALAEGIGTEVEGLTERLQRLLADSTIIAVQGTAEGARDLVRDLSAVVESERVELRRLMESLRSSADQVGDLAQSEALSSAIARFDRTLERLEAAGSRLEEASASLTRILARVEAGEGTLGLLATDEGLYRNLSSAAVSLERLLEDVRENPGRYVRIRIF